MQANITIVTPAGHCFTTLDKVRMWKKSFPALVTMYLSHMRG